MNDDVRKVQRMERADIVIRDDHNGFFSVIKDREEELGERKTLEQLVERLRRTPDVLVYWRS